MNDKMCLALCEVQDMDGKRGGARTQVGIVFKRGLGVKVPDLNPGLSLTGLPGGSDNWGT